MAPNDTVNDTEAERGVGRPKWSLDPYQIRLEYRQRPTVVSTTGIVQNTGADWFGPLNPMSPSAPVEVTGRQMDFPVGYNLAQNPRAYEPIGFPQLQALAQVYDVLRLVIETRKDEMERLDWVIRPREKTLNRVGAKLDANVQARIDAIKKFFRKPDGYTPWGSWLRMLLEDLYVIDAPTLYCQRLRSGQLYALHPMDGATIKRVVDDWGHTPRPYAGPGGALIKPPAYQQVLKGLPAINYTVADMIYRPRNVRAGKIYGFSPVEQILMTINIGLRRQMWQLSYYTEGNIPEAFIGVPDNWTPEQIKSYQNYFDTYFMGNNAARRRAKFVPGTMAKTYVQTKDPEMMNTFDEWCARIVCFAFAVSPQAFVRMMNRATGETAQDTAEETGLQATKHWLKTLIDDVIEQEFNSPDLEFRFAEEEEINQEAQQKILSGYAGDGAITINQMREKMGEEPYGPEFPAANIPMVKVGAGWVPIDANTIEGKKAALDALGPPPGPGGPFGADPDDPDADPEDDPEGGGKPPFGGKAKPKPKPGEKVKAGAKEKPAPAEKHAHVHGTARFEKAARRSKKRIRRLSPIPPDRDDTRKARIAIRGIFFKLFGVVGPAIAAEVRTAIGKLDKAKTSKERAKEIADGVDLDKFKSVYGKVQSELEAVAAESGGRALAQIGVDEKSQLFDQVNEEAVDWSKKRAAEMLGMRVNDDGDLVENPNAKWSVTESTRNMVRDTIAKGLEDNIGGDEIANQIEALGFTQERADLIARTEIANANSQAALDGYILAREEAGIVVKKEWLLGPNPCDVCMENAEAGPIDLEDEFPSGDDAPTAHPNCECALMPVVIEPSNQDETE